jgi:hypothetical protein
MYCTSKIVVFDLDETLGYYVEFGMFWDALKNFIKTQNISINVDQVLFNKVLDLYPEFLRPNIINILNFLKQKKRVKHCHKLMIYTNNQGPDEWAQQIQSYFEAKINYKLFDQIIKAFKIRGKQVELCRTSHMKNHKDLISCTKIPETTEICFLDDVFHPGMVDDKIYYINLKPYVHDLPFELMIDRFINSEILKEGIVKTDFKQDMLKFMNRYHHEFVEKTTEAQNVDKILSKKIMQHLQVFFTKGTNKPAQITRRTKKKGLKIQQSKNKTIKKKRSVY